MSDSDPATVRPPAEPRAEPPVDSPAAELERARLALETRRFEADLNRLTAEVAKIVAETRKLDLEAADLRIPFHRRPAYVAAWFQGIALVVAVASALFTFSVWEKWREADKAVRDAENAQREKNAAEEALKTLQTEKIHLDEVVSEARIAQAQAEQDRLSARQAATAALQRIDQLHADVASVRDQRDTLQRDVDALRTTEQAERQNVLSAPAATLIGQFGDARGRAERDAILERIAGMLNSSDPQVASATLDYLRRQSRDQSVSAALRASLLLILNSRTHAVEELDHLRDLLDPENIRDFPQIAATAKTAMPHNRTSVDRQICKAFLAAINVKSNMDIELWMGPSLPDTDWRGVDLCRIAIVRALHTDTLGRGTQIGLLNWIGRQPDLVHYLPDYSMAVSWFRWEYNRPRPGEPYNRRQLFLEHVPQDLVTAAAGFDVATWAKANVGLIRLFGYVNEPVLDSLPDSILAKFVYGVWIRDDADLNIIRAQVSHFFPGDYVQ